MTSLRRSAGGVGDRQCSLLVDIWSERDVAHPIHGWSLASLFPIVRVCGNDVARTVGSSRLHARPRGVHFIDRRSCRTSFLALISRCHRMVSRCIRLGADGLRSGPMLHRPWRAGWRATGRRSPSTCPSSDRSRLDRQRLRGFDRGYGRPRWFGEIHTQGSQGFGRGRYLLGTPVSVSKSEMWSVRRSRDGTCRGKPTR